MCRLCVFLLFSSFFLIFLLLSYVVFFFCTGLLPEIED